MKKLLALCIVGGLLCTMTGCPSPSTGPTSKTGEPGKMREGGPGKGRGRPGKDMKDGPGGEPKESKTETTPPKKDEGKKDEGKKDQGKKDEGKKDQGKKDEGKKDEGKKDK